MRYLLVGALAAAILSACGERPPRTDPEKVPAYNRVNGPGQLFERAQTQGESERIGY